MTRQVLFVSLLFSFLALPASLFGQSVAVNSVVPSSPLTSCTNSFVTISGFLSSVSYTYNGASVSTVGNTITVTVDYNAPFIVLPAIGQFVQTVSLGNIPAGTYNLVAVGTLNGAFQSSQTTSITVVSCCPAIPSFTTSASSLCPGDSLHLINTSTGQTTNTWYQNGSLLSTATDVSLVLNTPGNYTYKLVVSDGICSDSTETTVTVNLLPVINLGPDTSLCQGNALTLDPGPLYPAYAWSTGASTQTISVASVGTYSVTVTDINGCFIADTLSVNAVLPNVQASLGNDTSLCPGDSIVLNPGQNWTSYLWSNGSSGSTLTAANGTYSVTVSATGLCPGSASINLSEYPVLPFSLGNDTTACDSVILDAGNQFAQYAWSSGENSASITATSTNIYTITVTDANGCTQTDQRTVTLTGSPDVDLGFDKLACLEGQGELLNATVPGTGITYLWQDGSTAATFLAQSNVPGIFSYWVQVTEGNGCVDADTVAVEFQTCTSVEEHSKYFSFQAHPNPANEVLYLKSNQQGAATYAMVNLQGQVVQSGNVQLSLQSEALSISSLASGVYFLKVEIEGIFHVQRIVVE